MTALLNHNSYAIAAAIVIVVAAYQVYRRGPTPLSVALFAALALALVLPPLYVRAGGHEQGALERALTSGRPTLLQVYSDL